MYGRNLIGTSLRAFFNTGDSEGMGVKARGIILGGDGVGVDSAAAVGVGKGVGNTSGNG